MEILYRVSLVLHVLSAITWVGGVIFFAAVAIPVTRRLQPQLRRQMTLAIGRQFRPVGWTALTLLVLTGSVMIYRWGLRWDTLIDLSFFDAPHARLLGYKLLAVLAMLVVSGVHDFWLGPRSAKLTPDSAEAEKARRWASVLGRLTGGLVVVIAILAVFVARPWL